MRPFVRFNSGMNVLCLCMHNVVCAPRVLWNSTTPPGLINRVRWHCQVSRPDDVPWHCVMVCWPGVPLLQGTEADGQVASHAIRIMR